MSNIVESLYRVTEATNIGKTFSVGEPVSLSWNPGTIFKYLDDEDTLKFPKFVGRTATIIGTEFDDYLNETVYVVKTKDGYQFTLRGVDLLTPSEESLQAFNSARKL